MLTSVPAPERVVGEPEWIESTFDVKRGRDPLGLETITTDRIIPQLVPGILALSRRARYFSLYAFLLDEYREQRLAASNQVLSTFIKAREYEYALAVQRCPNGCGAQSSGVVGKQRAGPVARLGLPAFERGESVESYLGGYGLYYRTPLTDLGIVAPAGSLLGTSPTHVDVLVPGDRAEGLAAAFRTAIADTRYYKDYMRGIDPIPAEVLDELAGSACLCRLPRYPDEQGLLRNVLFAPAERSVGVDQRRRSFALFLSLLEMESGIVDADNSSSDAAFRSAIWRAFKACKTEKNARAATTAQWAALVGKDYMQDALSLIWMAFCRRGLTAQPPDGFVTAEIDQLIREVLVGAGNIELPSARVPYEQGTATSAFMDAIDAASRDLSLEEVRQWALETGTAMAGLALLVALFARLPDVHTVPQEWSCIGGMTSSHQPGPLGLNSRLTQHLAGNPSLADTMAWLVQRYILLAHESIAYSKLPDFTFRFRWENGRLHFYDLNDARFGLADIRRDSMSWISEDIGLWERVHGVPTVTPMGRQFLAEVFA